MLLGGIDLETGGAFDLPLEENFIVELGLVVWDTDLNSPVALHNWLVNEGKEMHPEASEYNGITNKMLQEWGEPQCEVLNQTAIIIESCDYIVAQNGGNFDEPIIMNASEFERITFPKKHWIDTKTDVPYPKNCMSRNLTYLTAFHKMVNCFAHRAVTDVLMMMEILSKYPLDKVLEISHSPTLRVVADVSFDKKHLAKDAGFYWDGSRKEWFKDIKELFYKDEASKWPFCARASLVQ